MKKKIIFVTKALWIGGIETALINLLNQFDYDKYDVTLLILQAELDMKEQIHSKCRLLIADRERTFSFNAAYRHKRLFHLTEEAENPSKLHRAMFWVVPIIKWVENRLYINYIRNFMKEEHFETAVIYSDVVAETAIKAIDADKFLMFYHHGAMRHVYHDEIAYKKCEKIIAVSENQANELKKFVPKAADKIISIHNLTDIKGICAKADLPCAEVFDVTKFNIVSVGRISHEKGMDIAVEVCARLVTDGYDNICWWIIGDGPDMHEVLDIIEELQMEKYVCVVGMKNNPYPYIRQADLYVQPSRFESFGLTIMEALILGKVVVSTDTLGAREILSGRKNCILCKKKVSMIVEVIEKYINYPEMLQLTERESFEFEEENRLMMKKLEYVL